MLDSSRGREIPWPPFPSPSVAEARAAAESAVAQDAGRSRLRPGRSQPGPAELPAASRTFPGRRRTSTSSVSFRDLAEAHFDGHPYVARRAVNQWIRAGAFKETTATGPQGQCLQGAHRHPPPAPSWPAGKLSGRGSTPGSGPGPAWSIPANSPMTPRSMPGGPGGDQAPPRPKDLPSAASGSMPN